MSWIKLKICSIQLKLSWKCKQLDFESSWIQNVNLKLNLTINLLKHYALNRSYKFITDSRNGQFALQGIRKNYQKGEKHSDVYRRIANSEKDSRDRNRNWNDSDIHAWTRQIQQSDKRLRQNNHNGSETASY